MEDRGKASEGDVETAKRSGNEIYIGFDKGDSIPRKGRKGRLVSDDPKRYPDRDAFSGGWAGGEVGLREFVKVSCCDITVYCHSKRHVNFHQIAIMLVF